MRAVAFQAPGQIEIVERPRPVPRAGEAVIRITATTICGTDVHIIKGEYSVRPGLILGHEPVGVIDQLGPGLEGEYQIGQRVIVGAITPCGEFLLVPDARANLAPIPDGLTDEDVLLVRDIFSTGLSGAESGNVKVGDSVAVFAQGPIGLCATIGARLRGASLIIAVDTLPERLEMARRFGATA